MESRETPLNASRSRGQKNSRIYVRVSAAEHAEMTQRARAAGLGISEFVRKAALGNNDRPTIRVDSAKLKVLYRDLRHCGGNLNQISKVLNTYGKPFEIEQELISTLRSVSKAADALSAFIADVRRNI